MQHPASLVAERPSHPAPGPSSAAAAPLTVETRPLTAMAPLAAAWSDLAARALERNVFCEPAFALAVAAHLPEARRIEVALVWAGGSRAPGDLVGVFPMVRSRGPRVLAALRLWRPHLGAQGTPLVDRARATAVLAAFLALARERGHPAVMAPMGPQDGPFAQALADVAQRTGRRHWCLDAHARAMLPGGTAHEAGIDAALGGKKAKDLRRQLRRLADLGEVGFTYAETPEAVREAIGRFLTLEASGWKGRRGTALRDDAGAVAFLDTMTGALAADGRCRVALLMVGQQAVAAGIVLTAGDRAWFWKIAFDEAFARASPGVQLTLELSRRLRADAAIAATDSCAVADHPMIDHLWRARLVIADVVVATRSGAAPAASLAVRLDCGQRRLRAFAKRVYHRLRARPSPLRPPGAAAGG